MLKRLLLLSLLAGFAASSLYSQVNVDSVIARNYRIRGSFDQYNSIKSIETKTTLTADAQTITGKTYFVKPDKIKIESSAMDQKAIYVINGTKGHVTDGKQVGEIPADKIENAKKGLSQQANPYEPVFFDMKEKEYKIEFAGKETLDEGECDILKLTDKDKKVFYVYFLENGMEVKMRTKQETQKGEKEFEYFFKENKKTGAFFVPHLVEVKVDGEDAMKTKYDYIIFNGKIKDEQFTVLPPTKK
jgi:hypothetical protein